MVNPYSPNSLHSNASATNGTIASISPHVSVLLLVVSACLAYVDARQIVPSSLLAGFCSLLSTLGHAPGFIAAIFFRRKRGAAGLAAFLLVFAVGILGVIAYLAYALTGKSENPGSAGHMHVIMFPLAYMVFATVVIIGGSVLLSVVGNESNDCGTEFRRD